MKLYYSQLFVSHINYFPGCFSIQSVFEMQEKIQTHIFLWSLWDDWEVTVEMRWINAGPTSCDVGPALIQRIICWIVSKMRSPCHEFLCEDTMESDPAWLFGLPQKACTNSHTVRPATQSKANNEPNQSFWVI